MIRVVLAILLMLGTYAGAQVLNYGGSVGHYISPNSGANQQVFSPALTGGGGGGCTESAAYIAALPNALNGTETGAFQTAICGMVSNGTFSIVKGMWFLANGGANTGNVKINVVNPGGTVMTEFGGGSCAFTQDHGTAGNGTTCYFNSNFDFCAQTSCDPGNISMGVCVLTSSTSASSGNLVFGANDAGPHYTYLTPLKSASSLEYNMGGNFFPSASTINNTNGSWIVSRPASNSPVVYYNGSSIATPIDPDNPVTGNGNATTMAILGYNSNGSFSAGPPLALGWVFFGNGMTGPQVAGLNSLLSAMLQTLNSGTGTGC